MLTDKKLCSLIQENSRIMLQEIPDFCEFGRICMKNGNSCLIILPIDHKNEDNHTNFINILLKMLYGIVFKFKLIHFLIAFENIGQNTRFINSSSGLIYVSECSWLTNSKRKILQFLCSISCQLQDLAVISYSITHHIEETALQATLLLNQIDNQDQLDNTRILEMLNSKLMKESLFPIYKYLVSIPAINPFIALEILEECCNEGLSVKDLILFSKTQWKRLYPKFIARDLVKTFI